MPKVGGKRRKNRTHKEITEDEEMMMENIPKSFIFKRGKVPNMIKNVVSDMREIMHPYTSLNLKESDKTKIKEYISTAKTVGVSHFQIFTSSEKHNYLRFVKSPQGPTITFKIISYCTRKDVSNNSLKKKQFTRTNKPPVLVMSGFNKELTAKNVRNPPTTQQYQVVSQMVQSMFPPLNLQKAKISNIQRVVLFNYDYNKDIVYLRHYNIQLVPVSQNKVMQKVLRAKNPPNLRDYNDFSDFITKNKKKGSSGNVSESEADDLPDANVEIDKKSFKKQFTTKLHEIGPRLKMRLYKIEEGILSGNVIYNRMVQKKAEEIEAQRKKIIEQRKLKEERRREQEKNVQKKKKEQKIKEKEKQKKQQQQMENMQQSKLGTSEFGEIDEGEYDEPDEEQIIGEEGIEQTITKEEKQKQKEEQGSDDGEEQEFRGLDEDNQDFDDELSEEESEQFIRGLEKQLQQLQKDNANEQFSDDDEEEEEEEDDEEEQDDDEEDDE